MLDNLSALMSVTLGGSVCILLFLAAGPLLSKRFTPRWRYCAWGVLAAGRETLGQQGTRVSRPVGGTVPGECWRRC